MDTSRHRIEEGTAIPNDPQIKVDSNSPFITRDQRETWKRKEDERPGVRQIQQPPLLLDQKIYDTSRKPPAPSQFPPTFIPLYTPDGAMYNSLFPYSKVVNQPPLQKIYNINLANPAGDHTTLNRIFEDMLPGGKPWNFTSLTVFERSQLIDWLRNTLIQRSDGEEMTVTGSFNSLLSYLKLMDINPYTMNVNPYEDLARNFLLYRSAYPVRYDEQRKIIGIAKNAMGVNIRLYKMPLGAYKLWELSSAPTKTTYEGEISGDRYDLWREIKYYNWVKSIFKNKVSPNFIAPICYKVDSNSRINWDKLDIIKYDKKPSVNLEKMIDNERRVNRRHMLVTDGFAQAINPLTLTLPRKVLSDLNKGIKTNIENTIRQLSGQILRINSMDNNKPKLDIMDIVNQMITQINNVIGEINKKLGTTTNLTTSIDLTFTDAIKQSISDEINNLYNKIIDNVMEDVTCDSGKVLILLTEAPTSGFLQWCSSQYESSGTIRKMISTGYHMPEVWKSVIFQIVYAFSVMEKKELCFNKFNRNNIYLKDVVSVPEVNNCWIYRVNKMNYYVPNYGYIAMIDSKYSDIILEENCTNKEQQFKIYGKLFNVNNSCVNSKEKLVKQFKDFFNRDSFDSYLKQAGAKLPDETILTLINSISDSISRNNEISKVLIDCFKDYVHNRVGTLLTITEKNNLNIMAKPKFDDTDKGKPIVYQERFDTYKWIIYVGDSTSKPFHKQVIKEKGGQVEEVPTNRLFAYPSDQTIGPEPGGDKRQEVGNVLETYDLDNLN
jgi:hypothetical protein